MIMVNKGYLILVLLIALAFTSCEEDVYTPKPKAFFRIDLPEKNYERVDFQAPYSFELPGCTQWSWDKAEEGKPSYWINVDYPQFRGRIHFSYKAVDNNLAEYLSDARKLTTKQIPKADMIEEIPVYDPNRDVYGLVYNVEGIGAASTMQFFVTDSTNHFLRGALYFNAVPNNDSLAPVIEYIKEDISHIIGTLRWEE